MGHTSTATVTATALTKNTATADIVMSGGTAFTDASTLQIAYPREGKLLILINSTYAQASTAVIEAGEFTGAGVGDLSITTAQNGVYAIVIESDKYKDFDGYMNITFGASNTGFVRALSFPY